MTAALVLASASTSRARLLRDAGIAFRQQASTVDEEELGAARPTASADVLTLALARAKAEQVAERFAGPTLGGSPALVLGCDSLLEFEGRTWGKPGSAAAATARWRAQRGRTATLVTGHWLIAASNGQAAEAVVATEVTFADASDAEIADYVASGEPLWVAGAFTLEGRAAPLISGIVGDPSNVVGLSLPALRIMLGTLGFQLRDVATPAPADSRFA